jgi:hypothetical protein
VKKVLAGAAVLFLFLSFGAAGLLEAAECPAAALLTPAVPALAPMAGAPEGQDAKLADILALNPLSSAEEKAPPPDDCSHIACIQTPEGCGCDGFWCGPIFICGIPWH